MQATINFLYGLAGASLLIAYGAWLNQQRVSKEFARKMAAQRYGKVLDRLMRDTTGERVKI